MTLNILKHMRRSAIAITGVTALTLLAGAPAQAKVEGDTIILGDIRFSFKVRPGTATDHQAEE